MIRITFIAISIFWCTQSIAQKRFDMIISIDESINLPLSGIKMVAVTTTGKKDTINVDYYPGNLSMPEEDYRKLMDTSVKTVYLVFNYEEHQVHNDKYFHYDIDLKKGWLTHYYYILYIYNTSKPKYRNTFNAPKGKTYVYEFDYPGGSTKLIRNRNSRK